MTTDAVEILRTLFIGDDPERQAALDYERELADFEQMWYDALRNPATGEGGEGEE